MKWDAEAMPVFVRPEDMKPMERWRRVLERDRTIVVGRYVVGTCGHRHGAENWIDDTATNLYTACSFRMAATELASDLTVEEAKELVLSLTEFKVLVRAGMADVRGEYQDMREFIVESASRLLARLEEWVDEKG